MNLKIEIKDTEKYGKGVYAKEDIKKGEIITILSGKEIIEKLCDKMIEDGLLNNDDPLQIENEKYLILDDLSHAFNHSCEPNAGLKDISTLFAIRDIFKGEEITYDYSTTVYPKNLTFTTMTSCQCGSSKCRKVLGNVLSIPKEVLDFYKFEGALQDYIINALKADNNY